MNNLETRVCPFFHCQLTHVNTTLPTRQTWFTSSPIVTRFHSFTIAQTTFCIKMILKSIMQSRTRHCRNSEEFNEQPAGSLHSALLLTLFQYFILYRQERFPVSYALELSSNCARKFCLLTVLPVTCTLQVGV